MPLYEYECDANGHRFEVIQKFSDPPIERCPTCGSTVHKLMSSPAIQFKGSGWYVTDYARKGETKDAKDAKTAKEGASKDAKATTDTKEAKSEKTATDGTSGSTATTSKD